MLLLKFYPYTKENHSYLMWLNVLKDEEPIRSTKLPDSPKRKQSGHRIFSLIHMNSNNNLLHWVSLAEPNCSLPLYLHGHLFHKHVLRTSLKGKIVLSLIRRRMY